MKHGEPVEAPDVALWHLRRSDGRTFCGRDAETWPVVFQAVERRGIWCGLCLLAAGGKVKAS